MILTNEIMSEVFRRFSDDRGSVSTRDLEWLRRKLRKYCDEDLPKIDSPRTPEREKREVISMRVKAAHREAERKLTAQANSVNQMSPSQLANYLAANVGRLETDAG